MMDLFAVLDIEPSTAAMEGGGRAQPIARRFLNSAQDLGFSGIPGEHLENHVCATTFPKKDSHVPPTKAFVCYVVIEWCARRTLVPTTEGPSNGSPTRSRSGALVLDCQSSVSQSPAVLPRVPSRLARSPRPRAGLCCHAAASPPRFSTTRRGFLEPLRLPRLKRGHNLISRVALRGEAELIFEGWRTPGSKRFRLSARVRFVSIVCVACVRASLRA